MARHRPQLLMAQRIGLWLGFVATFGSPQLALGDETRPNAATDSTEPEVASESVEATTASPTEHAEGDGEAGAEATEPTVEVKAPGTSETDELAQHEKTQPVDSSVLTSIETPGEEDRRKKEKPATRFSEVGVLVGMAYRPSSSDRFTYRPGVAYGGFFRPQITDYLAVRLAYREERIPVEVASGAYDYQGQSSGLDLSQPNLKVANIGVRIEPSFHLTKYIHLTGVLSWSWVRIVYPMPEAVNFNQRANRSGVELNWGLGGGVSIDLLHNWLNLNISGVYHFVSNQTGLAYEPVQAIVDGQITYFAPMARPKSLTDVLLSIGLIL